MRCATCGTENEPNSRFCGGCGARQPASGEQRLAPTAKISDDAPYPQQQAGRPGVAPQGPVSYAPPSIPPPAMSSPPMSTPPPGSLVRPQSQNPASVRPSSSPPAARPVSAPPRAAARPQVSSVSESMPVPAQRPIGLMVALLVVDIGLAAAGGVLLSKGLADREAKKAEPAQVDRKTEAPRATAAPAIDRIAATAAPTTPPSPPVTMPAPSAAAVAKPDANAAARESPKRATDPKAAKVVDTRPTDPKLADKRPESTKVIDTKPVDPKTTAKPDDGKTVPVVPTQPQDPYAAPNTEREIDAEAAASKASFAECAADHPGHGAIKIAFQVRYDGRVINAGAVENTTGNADLARCLISEISTWRVSAHNGTSINLLRPFTYP